MAEHNHSKDLSLKEQMESYDLRRELNELTYRFDNNIQRYRRAHNSGYCSYEMLRPLQAARQQLDVIIEKLEALGQVEHFNFEIVLGLAEEDHA